MITWVQRYFQKHFKFVFLMLLAVMTISMVFIYSASGGLGRTTRPREEVTFFGQEWVGGERVAALQTEAQISSMFSANTFTGNLEARAALLYLADKLGVPAPSTEQLAEFVKTRRAFQGPDGNYDPQQYQNIRDQLVGNVFGISEAQVRRVLLQDWRLEQVLDGIMGPGYVPDAEITREFVEAESLWTVHTATMDLSNIEANAEPTEDELRVWFEASMARYETPSRVIVDYVEFTPAMFAEDEAIKDEDIVSYFERNKARYQPQPTPNADGTTPAPVEVTLADVRDRVINDLKQARAVRRAEEAASDLAADLSRNSVDLESPAFRQLLDRHGLTLKSAPPFPQNEWPRSLNWSPTIANAAWRLSESNPISDKLRAGDTSIVLFYRGRTPPVEATLAEVRDRVVADVKADKRRQAIVARGQALQQELSTAVAGGKSFTEAAQASGLETQTYEKFKISGRPPEGMNPAIFQNLPQQTVGTVSQPSIQGDRVSFVFVSERQEPDTTTAGEALETARKNVREGAARLAANIAMRDMIEKALIEGGARQSADVEP